MAGSAGWAGYDQPTLASADLSADEWETGRVPAHIIALTEDTATAAQLVHAGGCSPQCLVSAGVPVRSCDCACRGAYHGVLADADIRFALQHRKATAGA